jgi:hypothetical protein
MLPLAGHSGICSRYGWSLGYPICNKDAFTFVLPINQNRDPQICRQSGNSTQFCNTHFRVGSVIAFADFYSF